MEAAWSIVLSFITACTAIIALLFSGFQIRQSNKQHLLDRRIKIWSVTVGFGELCKNNLNSLKNSNNRENELIFSNDIQFVWLTNSSYLCDITSVINNVLDPVLQKAFLNKIEEIKQLSVEATLVFRGDASAYISKFLDSYRLLLFSMYQYQVLLSRMTDDAEKSRLSLEEAVEKFQENQYRAELHTTKSELLNSYDTLERPKVRNRIVRQIRLTLR